MDSRVQDGAKRRLQRAQITLNDCLACSGCITSAEHILITQQSLEELYRVFRENQAADTIDDVSCVFVINRFF
jgi:iron only hydrogenase large subunit-like protein